MMDTQTNAVQRAIEYLGAVEVDSRYAYHAAETHRYYIVDLGDLDALTDMLARGTGDAYSLWCADSAVEMPAWWAPERQVVRACVTHDGWSLHDDRATDEEIAEGEALAITSDAHADLDHPRYRDGQRITADLETGEEVSA